MLFDAFTQLNIHNILLSLPFPFTQGTRTGSSMKRKYFPLKNKNAVPNNNTQKFYYYIYIARDRKRSL